MTNCFGMACGVLVVRRSSCASPLDGDEHRFPVGVSRTRARTVTHRQRLEQALASMPKRSLESTLFNLAHAYARAADASWNNLGSTKDADFAAPAIMCQSFAIELLLKFFLAIDNPSATTADDLKKAGVRLKCHKYSELFDQLLPATKEKIANAFARLSGKKTDAAGFRVALIAQGDDPFVYWRYVYETSGVSHFDNRAFSLVTDAIGKAAETERMAASSRR